jgi:hypothetical protein
MAHFTSLLLLAAVTITPSPLPPPLSVLFRHAPLVVVVLLSFHQIFRNVRGGPSPFASEMGGARADHEVNQNAKTRATNKRC